MTESMEETFQAVIKRKDEEIAKLKEQNMLLMKSSLKRAEELEKMRELAERLHKRKENL